MLRYLFGLIIFYFVSSSLAVNNAAEKSISFDIHDGELQEVKLNQVSPSQMLYKFLAVKWMYGSNIAINNVYEFYYKETNCTKADAPMIKDCQFDPNGKTAICQVKTTWTDVSTCKFTGDKYKISKNDRRGEEFAFDVINTYNKKNYGNSTKRLSHAILMTADVDAEVTVSGTKNVIKFATQEVNVIIKKENNKKKMSETFDVTVPRVDCQATVVEYNDDSSFSRMVIKNKVVDVKCQPNQDPGAIANMIPPELIWNSKIMLESRLQDNGMPLFFSMKSTTSIFRTDKTLTRASDIGIIVEQLLNKQPNQEYLWKYVFRKAMFGDNPQRENVQEVYCQETDCKKAETQLSQTLGLDVCKTKLNGKIAVCLVKTAIKDLSSCKYTGDKYEMPPDDRRTLDLSGMVLSMHNWKLKRNRTIYPSLGYDKLTITAPAKGEITKGGIQNIVRFSTSEKEVTQHKNPKTGFIDKDYNNKKARVDCEAIVDFEMPTEKRNMLRPKIHITCRDSNKTLALRTGGKENFGKLVTYRTHPLHRFASFYLPGAPKKADVMTMSAEMEEDNLLEAEEAEEQDSHENKIAELAKDLETELNEKLKKEFLYKFIARGRFVLNKIDGLEDELVFELLFGETTCKKKNSKNIESCKLSPGKKIAICIGPDVKTCKFTGDKYEMDKKGMLYGVSLPGDAGAIFSDRNYPNKTVMLNGDTLESQIKFEIFAGNYKVEFKFNASLDDCREESDMVECKSLKRDIHCEAVMTYKVDKTVDLSSADVKCPNHKMTARSGSGKDKKKSNQFNKHRGSRRR